MDCGCSQPDCPYMSPPLMEVGEGFVRFGCLTFVTEEHIREAVREVVLADEMAQMVEALRLPPDVLKHVSKGSYQLAMAERERFLGYL